MQNLSHSVNLRFLTTLGAITTGFVLMCMSAEASNNACKKIYEQTIEHVSDKNWCLAKAGLSHISQSCTTPEFTVREKNVVQTNLKSSTAECEALDAVNIENQRLTPKNLENNKFLCGAPFSDDGTSTNACLAMGTALGVRSVRVIPFNDKTLPIQLDKGEIHVAINNGKSVQKPTCVHVSQHGFVAFHVQPEPFSQIAKLAFESLDERTPSDRLGELSELGMQLGLGTDWQKNVIDSYGTIDNLRGDKSYLKQK